MGSNGKQEHEAFYQQSNKQINTYNRLILFYYKKINMKILVTILLILAAIIILLLIVAMLIKKDFSLEKQVVINKPKQEVFDYLKMIKNQE